MKGTVWTQRRREETATCQPGSEAWARLAHGLRRLTSPCTHLGLWLPASRTARKLTSGFQDPQLMVLGCLIAVVKGGGWRGGGRVGKRGRAPAAGENSRSVQTLERSRRARPHTENPASTGLGLAEAAPNWVIPVSEIIKVLNT